MTSCVYNRQLYASATLPTLKICMFLYVYVLAETLHFLDGSFQWHLSQRVPTGSSLCTQHPFPDNWTLHDILCTEQFYASREQPFHHEDLYVPQCIHIGRDPSLLGWFIPVTSAPKGAQRVLIMYREHFSWQLDFSWHPVYIPNNCMFPEQNPVTLKFWMFLHRYTHWQRSFTFWMAHSSDICPNGCPQGPHHVYCTFLITTGLYITSCVYT